MLNLTILNLILHLLCIVLVDLYLYYLQKLQCNNRQDTKDRIKKWVNPKFVPNCLSLNLTTWDFALFGLQRNHIC